MKRYLLDTNICIFYMKGKYDLFAKISKVGIDNCYISEITVAELLYGVSCSAIHEQERARARTEELISLFNIIPIYSALSAFAEAKATLRARGELIDDFDLLIAATAIYHNMILVSENTRHVGRVPKVKTENWIKRY